MYKSYIGAVLAASTLLVGGASRAAEDVDDLHQRALMLTLQLQVDC